MSSYRQVLERVGQRTRIDPEAFLGLERRRRRRLRNRRIVSAVVAVAVAAGGTWGTLALVDLNGKARPAAAPALQTATANGITLTFPSDWTLIQQGRAGMDPHILDLQLSFLSVFQLSNYRPLLEPSALCPVSQSMPAKGVLLYVQRSIATGAGSFLGGTWPITPQLTRISAGALGDCGHGYRQQWHVGDRRFSAVIAFGPQASVGDRRALLSAFRSMDFRWIAYQDMWMNFVVPSSWDAKTRRLVRTLFYTPKQVLTSITSGRHRYTFTAMPDPTNTFEGAGATLELEWGTIGPLLPPDQGRSMIATRYHNLGRLDIVIGTVTSAVTRVEVVTGGRTYPATLLDFPQELPGDYRGYFMNLDGITIRGGEIVARDAQGRVLQRLPLLGP
jgi:hypothetical protein